MKKKYFIIAAIAMLAMSCNSGVSTGNVGENDSTSVDSVVVDSASVDTLVCQCGDC